MLAFVYGFFSVLTPSHVKRLTPEPSPKAVTSNLSRFPCRVFSVGVGVEV